MSLATDANISKLQQMFPTVEGDVIAIILNDCHNNVEKCINHLLEMSCDIDETTAHNDIGHVQNHPPTQRPHYTQAVKTTTNPSGGGDIKTNAHTGGNQTLQRNYDSSLRAEREKYSSGSRGNNTHHSPAGTQGKSTGNHGDKPHPPKQDNDTVDKQFTGCEERKPTPSPSPSQHGANQFQPPGLVGVVRMPPFPHVDSRGLPIRPPMGNICYFRPPPQPPQFYPNGRPIERPPFISEQVPPWRARPEYGIGTERREFQPRIIGPGGISVVPSGMMLRPSGTTTVVRGCLPMVRSGPPMVHGGMLLRPNGMHVVPPRGHSGISVTSGTSLPSPHEPTQKPSNQHGIVAGLEGLVISDSHIPIPPDCKRKDKANWPIHTVSETGTEHGNLTNNNNTVDKYGMERGSEMAGKGWPNWADNTVKILVLIRGLPGSGKSTLARGVAGESGVICSTDDFFIIEGRYRFDRNKLGQNHDKNKEKAREAMVNNITPVVIDNTNASAWEMKPYVEMALSLGYKVELMESNTPWRFDCTELARRNSHGVPLDKIEIMLARYEHNITIESILTSQQPSKDRTRRSHFRDNGRGNHMTHAGGHMTSAHTRYARKQSPSAHNQNMTKFPSSSHPVFTSPVHSSGSSPSLTPHQSMTPNTLPIGQQGLPHISSPATYSEHSTHSPSLLHSPLLSHVPFHEPHSSSIGLPNSSSSASGIHNESIFQPPQLLSPNFQSHSLDVGNGTLPLGHGWTKDQEEQRAAKMSSIWGDGKLLDEVEELERRGSGDSDSGWGESARGGNWNQKIPFNGTTAVSSGVWNGLECVGGGVGSHSLHENGLIGHPSPCEFGPIGKKSTSTVTNGTTLQTKLDPTIDNSQSPTPGEISTGNDPLPHTRRDSSRKNGSKRSQERVTSGRPPSQSAEERGSELWVSEEIENWTYYGEMSENSSIERKKGGSQTSPASTSLHHDHDVEGGTSVGDGGPFQIPKDVMSDTLFDDPAIVNMVKESPQPPASSGEPTGNHRLYSDRDTSQLTDDVWREEEEEIDLESEDHEAVFTTPSSETSPKAPVHTPNHSSPIALLLPLSQPNVYSNKSTAPPDVYSNKSTAAPDVYSNKSTALPDVYSNKSTALPDVYSNKSTADDYSNESTAPTSMTSNDTLQCSTPTIIPYYDDENGGGLVMEAVGSEGRKSEEDYFPSAFECEGAPESNDNDVIVTSSANDVIITSSLPVNCISTTPTKTVTVDSRFWSSNENDDVIPLTLQANSLSSVQDNSIVDIPSIGQQLPPTSSDGVGDIPDTTYTNTIEAGDGEDRPEEEVDNTPDMQSDIVFLVECFPDLSETFLRLLLQQSEGNVEEAVSTALVSTVTSPTHPIIPGASNIFNMAFTSSLLCDSGWNTAGISSSAASVTSESEIEGGGVYGECVGSEEDDVCVDDEEIARIIQEQLNHSEEDAASLEAIQRITSQETHQRMSRGVGTGKKKEEERDITESTLLPGDTAAEDDENLVLRLSRSLASQLQRMFGPVNKHLPLEGILRDEDLQVLLSERAAHQIWQKWIDTLQAKKVEMQLHEETILRSQSAPMFQSFTDSKSPARSGTEPGQASNFAHIMSEQNEQDTSVNEVHKVVTAVCDETIARKMNLQQLYSRFRSVDKDTINYILLKNNFNFKTAAVELKQEITCGEMTDGSSHSRNPSSFAHTITKPGSGAKVGQPIHRSSLLTKKRRRVKTRPKHLQSNDEVVHKSYQELKECPSYDDLRAEAALHAKLRGEAFQKAAHARSRKQGDVAVYYAQKGHSHTEKMKEANRRAAALILQLQNDLSSQYLDLHGLHVEEALTALHDRLHNNTTDGVLYVITGKGIHSKGEARLKPAVTQFLRTKNYKYEEQPGRFKVKLT